MVQSCNAVEFAPMNGIHPDKLLCTERVRCPPLPLPLYMVERLLRILHGLAPASWPPARRAAWPTSTARPPIASGMWCAWESCDGAREHRFLPIHTARDEPPDLLGAVTSLVRVAAVRLWSVTVVAGDAVVPVRVRAELDGAGIGRENALKYAFRHSPKLMLIMKAWGLEGQP